MNIFRGKNLDETRQRVFGGQVAAQSLVAAGRTVDSGRVHSLHSYFLRPGDPSRADPVRGRPHPRRPVVHDATRGRDPARPGHLQPPVLVPHRRRARSRPPGDDAGRAPARGAADDPRAPRSPIVDQLPAWFVEDRPRPIDQRYVGELPWLTKETRRPASGCGFAPTGSCPTTPCSTPRWSPTPRTCRLIDSILKPHDDPMGRRDGR